MKRTENRLRLSVSSPSAGLPSEVVREVEECTEYLGDPQGSPIRLLWSRRVLCGVAHGCRHSCTAQDDVKREGSLIGDTELPTLVQETVLWPLEDREWWL